MHPALAGKGRGHRDQPPPQGGDHGLAAAHAAGFAVPGLLVVWAGGPWTSGEHVGRRTVQAARNTLRA
ncbi:MAG TPA: hypothetical protein VLW50_33670, partial [Streptosporangiaceae bacterium]|nr:hypothetical protein [Streptosporangiaceae bacterium]